MGDGESEYKKGLKAMKTGLFKRKPDTATAAIHFEAAAKAFEMSRNIEGAINAYEQLGKANELMNDNWAAGRAYENLSIISLRNEKYSKCQEATEKAVEMFRICANGEKALRMYSFMAAELCAKDIIELGNKMYALAINLITDENLQVYAKDIVGPYVTLLLEHKLYRDAMLIYQKELGFAKHLQRDHHINKVVFSMLALVLIDNPAQREEKFREMCSISCFPMSPEYLTISDLYDAYNEGDQEKFDKAARKASWNNVEAPLVRLIRAIKLEGRVIQGEEEENLDFT